MDDAKDGRGGLLLSLVSLEALGRLCSPLKAHIPPSSKRVDADLNESQRGEAGISVDGRSYLNFESRDEDERVLRVSPFFDWFSIVLSTDISSSRGQIAVPSCASCPQWLA
ncbi:MAG: hypothetical protein Q9165_008457 [Trypethelium subeluteriae]